MQSLDKGSPTIVTAREMIDSPPERSTMRRSPSSRARRSSPRLWRASTPWQSRCSLPRVDRLRVGEHRLPATGHALWSKEHRLPATGHALWFKEHRLRL